MPFPAVASVSIFASYRFEAVSPCSGCTSTPYVSFMYSTVRTLSWHTHVTSSHEEHEVSNFSSKNGTMQQSMSPSCMRFPSRSVNCLPLFGFQYGFTNEMPVQRPHKQLSRSSSCKPSSYSAHSTTFSATLAARMSLLSVVAGLTYITNLFFVILASSVRMMG